MNKYIHAHIGTYGLTMENAWSYTNIRITQHTYNAWAYTYIWTYTGTWNMDMHWIRKDHGVILCLYSTSLPSAGEYLLTSSLTSGASAGASTSSAFQYQGCK